MEENEDKKPVENEPESPEAEPEKPAEGGSEAPKEKGGKLDAVKAKAKVVKQKTGEFMGVKRNRIIVLACSGAAIVALVVGLSVGLTQCHGGNGGDATSSSNSDSGSDYSQYKVSDAEFSSAIKFEGDKFTISAAKDGSAETNSITKNGATVHLKNTSGEAKDVYYTKVTEDGSSKYYSYAKEGEYWMRSEDAEKLYDKYASVDVSRDIFDGKLSYQTLSFDGAKSAYTASYNDGTNEVTAELYFDTAKLVKAVKSYGGSVYTCTFSQTAETITLPTVHTHTFSSAWETKRKASKTTNGIKAHKCTVCGAYDEATQKEYDPFMDKDAYDWDKSLVYDGDITMRKDYYTYGGPRDFNQHYVLNSIRHGDVVKVWQDIYDYYDGFYYSTWLNWYTRVANATISYGYEYFEYDYDETSGKWDKSSYGSSDSDWVDYAEFDLQGGQDHIENYAYVEDEECYKRTVVDEDEGITATCKVYFDFGKVMKCSVESDDDGYITTIIYQFDYSSPELSLPDPDTHEHSWSTEYSTDGLSHWHECACGVRNEKEAHDFSSGYQVTKKASKTENGIKSASCATCSGSSGDRQYNPYMDNYDWNGIYSSYHHPYVSTVTTEEANVGTTTEETYYDKRNVRKVTHKLPAAGEASDETVYYTNSGSNEYDLIIKEDSNGTWVASPDYDRNWTNGPLSLFSAYNNGEYEEEKFTLVDEGDDSHYVTADGKVAIYFDLGRITKLIDETDSAKKKTITVRYEDIYRFALPEYSK